MASTKENVLELLKKNSGAYLSGQQIADSVFVTRAAVWKAIRSLKEEGYAISAVTRRGYRLTESLPAADPERIRQMMKEAGWDIPVYVFSEVTSTNDVCERCARESAGPCLVVAGTQTEGRGRRGRSFFSPADTGLYFLVLLFPASSLARLTDVTAFAAVAAAEAIDEAAFGGRDVTRIKWVNDIFIGGRKAAGILTEARSFLETDSAPHVIAGIGINVFPPADGFPKELKNTAGAVFKSGAEADPDIFSTLAAKTAARLLSLCTGGEEAHKACLETYRKKSFLIGSYVVVNGSADDRYALCTGITDAFHLKVRYDDGTEKELSSGEVSVARY